MRYQSIVNSLTPRSRILLSDVLYHCKGEVKMRERIDRFALSNVLHASIPVQGHRMEMVAETLCQLPAGWWLLPSESQSTWTAWKLLDQAINFVISAHEKNKRRLLCSRIFFKIQIPYPGCYGIEDIGASVLIGNQISYHISSYGGERWKNYLHNSFVHGKITTEWLDGLLAVRTRTDINTPLSIA